MTLFASLRRYRRLPLETLAASLLAAAPVGCASGPTAEASDGQAASDPSLQPPPVESEPTPPSPAAAPNERYVAAVAHQGVRVRRLQFLESGGSATLRWRDKKGAHSEQCDLTLYCIPPWKTALNISKVGERYAWIGSDEESWWIFQLGQRPTSLEIHRWAEEPAALADESLSIVSPGLFLQLAGLAAYPAADSPSIKVVEDVDAKRLTVEAPLASQSDASAAKVMPVGSTMRWTIDTATHLPSSVELLDANGKGLARSTLSEYVSAEINGAPPGDFPRVPTRVVIQRLVDGQPDEGYSMSITLDAPSARGQRIKPRFFRLNELVDMFRPEETYVRVQPDPVPVEPAPATQPVTDGEPRS
jgi:hypothetical protein